MALQTLREYLWSVAWHLVKEQQFSILNIENSIAQESPALHFIKNQKREYFYIRLVPIEYAWPNQINQDRQLLEDKLKKTKFFYSAKQIHLLNIYIFPSDISGEMKQVIMNSAGQSEKKSKINWVPGFIVLDEQEVTIDHSLHSGFQVTSDWFRNIYHLSPKLPIYEMIEEIKQLEYKRSEEIRSFFQFGKPYFTYIFILINVVLYGLMEFAGGSSNPEILLQFGAKESYLISQGEYWRLISPIFLHIGFIHFALNNVALHYLGSLTERIYGSLRFFFIYLIGGIIGNVASFLFSAEAIGAGASGSIFALFGGILYFGLNNPNLFYRTMGRDIITIIGINLVFGILVPNIDNFAHIGGLVGGFLAAAVIHLPKQVKKRWLLTGLAFLVLVASVGAVAWASNFRDVKVSQIWLLKGQEALQNKNLEDAERYISEYIASYPEDPKGFFYYGNLQFEKQQFAIAKENYLEAIELNSQFAEARFNLALIYLYYEDNLEEGRKQLIKALEISPDFKEARDLLNKLDD